MAGTRRTLQPRPLLVVLRPPSGRNLKHNHWRIKTAAYTIHKHEAVTSKQRLRYIPLKTIQNSVRRSSETFTISKYLQSHNHHHNVLFWSISRHGAPYSKRIWMKINRQHWYVQKAAIRTPVDRPRSDKLHPVLTSNPSPPIHLKPPK